MIIQNKLEERAVGALRVYISIDLEGLPGIGSISQLAPGLSMYNDARRIMTWIINVVLDELSKEEVDDVLVADSHGLMTNIDYLEVNYNARILQGYPRPYSMILGIEDGFDAAFFLGYHSAAGTPGGFLDHTYSSRVIYRVYLSGDPVSEYLINALYAGWYNTPVALVAGDEKLKDEVKRYTPWAFAPNVTTHRFGN